MRDKRNGRPSRGNTPWRSRPLRAPRSHSRGAASYIPVTGSPCTPEPGAYFYVCINSKGEIACSASQGNGSVVIWSNGKRSTLIDHVSTTALCWSPDGSRLALSGPKPRTRNLRLTLGLQGLHPLALNPWAAHDDKTAAAIARPEPVAG